MEDAGLRGVYIEKIKGAYEEGVIKENIRDLLLDAIGNGYLEGKYIPTDELSVIEGLEQVLDFYLGKVFPGYEEMVSPFADEADSKKAAEECAEDLKKRLKSETCEKKQDKSSQ